MQFIYLLFFFKALPAGPVVTFISGTITRSPQEGLNWSHLACVLQFTEFYRFKIHVPTNNNDQSDWAWWWPEHLWLVCTKQTAQGIVLALCKIILCHWFVTLLRAVVVFLNFVSLNIWAAFQCWSTCICEFGFVDYVLCSDRAFLSFEVCRFPFSINQSIMNF